MRSAARTVGRYKVLGEVGRGGMAIVYVAHDAALDRQVALKELYALGAADSSLVQRFVREARVAGSLSHPNIVTVHDFFEPEGVPYIAMEYVQGGSLRPLVGTLSLPQIAGVLEGVPAGLAHAERRGVAHRDLKPVNLLTTHEGTGARCRRDRRDRPRPDEVQGGARVRRDTALRPPPRAPSRTAGRHRAGALGFVIAFAGNRFATDDATSLRHTTLFDMNKRWDYGEVFGDELWVTVPSADAIYRFDTRTGDRLGDPIGFDTAVAAFNLDPPAAPGSHCGRARWSRSTCRGPEAGPGRACPRPGRMPPTDPDPEGREGRCPGCSSHLQGRQSHESCDGSASTGGWKSFDRRSPSREWRREVSGEDAARATIERRPTISVAVRARVIAV